MASVPLAEEAVEQAGSGEMQRCNVVVPKLANALRRPGSWYNLVVGLRRRRVALAHPRQVGAGRSRAKKQKLGSEWARKLHSGRGTSKASSK